MKTRKSAIHLLLLVLSGSACSWSATVPEPPAFQVTIRLLGSDEVYRSYLAAAKDVAAAILATAGVDVRWQGPGATHPAPGTIDVRFGHSMPGHGTDGALAESHPLVHTGVRITVFLDRVAEYANRNPLLMPRILGHVLAHEIGHVLLGTSAHAREGVMKAYWDHADYRTMHAKNLEFTREDAAAIGKKLRSAL